MAMRPSPVVTDTTEASPANKPPRGKSFCGRCVCSSTPIKGRINGTSIIGPLVALLSVSEKFGEEPKEISEAGGLGTLMIAALITLCLAITLVESTSYRVPILSRAADLVLDRTINFKMNWENDTLRSFIETACWLHLTILLHTRSQNVIFSAPAGALLGFALVVAGDLTTTFLRTAEQSLLGDRLLLGSLGMAELTSLVGALVCCVFFRLGTEFGETMASVLLGNLSLVILGQMLLTCGGGNIDGPSHQVGALLHDRIWPRHAARNWLFHPLRSSMETSACLACVFGARWLAHADLLASVAIGTVSSGLCIVIIVTVDGLTAEARAKLHRPGTPRSRTRTRTKTKRGISGISGISGHCDGNNEAADDATSKRNDGAAAAASVSSVDTAREKWRCDLRPLRVFVSACDRRVSKRIFDECQSRRKSLKPLATLCSLLVDDGTCLLLLIGSWFFVLYRQWAGSLSVAIEDPPPGTTNHCTVEAIVQSYLLFMSWSALETSLKLLVRQPRPAYRRQKPLSDVIIPGDQFSWPSGHSIRAFAVARAPFASPSLRQLGWSLATTTSAGTGTDTHRTLEVALLAVALCAGWSRVALGKHSVLDVVVGATIGLLWFPFFEHVLGSDPAWILGCQLLCGVYYLAVGVAAISSDRARRFLGLVHVDQLARFLATAVWGSWMYMAARFDNAHALGHHHFARCGVSSFAALDDVYTGIITNGDEGRVDFWAPMAMAVAVAILAFCLLSAALVAQSNSPYRLLLFPAALFAVVAAEMSSLLDTRVVAFLRPHSVGIVYS